MGQDFLASERMLTALDGPESPNDNTLSRPRRESYDRESRPGSSGRYEIIDESDFEDLSSMTDVLRDLSLEASGGYIGASSTITLGRMMNSIVKKDSGVRIKNETEAPDSLLNFGVPSPDDKVSTMDHNLLTEDVTDKLVHAYIKYVTHRMPALFTPGIWRKHMRRYEIQNAYQKATLHLVYALGGRALETIGESGDFSPDRHYDAAVAQLEEVLEYNDIRCITVLLLLALYCLRDPRSPGAWYVYSDLPLD